MHIMEGFLDPIWCAVWFVIAIPIVALGAKKVIELMRDHPEHKMTIALSGAFIFLLSSLKIPSVTGSSSHPTGTGFAVVMYGIATCAFLSTIVLIFQAILLAHGGLTTLGANICSMGIIGPAAGLGIWLMLIKSGAKIPVALLCAAFIADLVTYVVTAFQMSLNFGFEYFIDYLSNYAVTQIPLAIVEAILFFMFGMYLMNNKPEIFDIAQGMSDAKKEEA